MHINPQIFLAVARPTVIIMNGSTQRKIEALLTVVDNWEKIIVVWKFHD